MHSKTSYRVTLTFMNQNVYADREQNSQFTVNITCTSVPHIYRDRPWKTQVGTDLYRQCIDTAKALL